MEEETSLVQSRSAARVEESCERYIASLLEKEEYY